MSVSIDLGTPDSFDELIAAQNVLVVVYFWGPDCPNCEVFARDLPELVEAISMRTAASPTTPDGYGAAPLSQETDVKIVKVNAYEFPELARRFALFGIPGFVLFKDGVKLGMMRQYNGREYWKAVVTEHARGRGARL